MEFDESFVMEFDESFVVHLAEDGERLTVRRSNGRTYCRIADIAALPLPYRRERYWSLSHRRPAKPLSVMVRKRCTR
jgi:hypothetical protein